MTSNEEKFTFDSDLSPMVNWCNGMAYGMWSMLTYVVSQVAEHSTCRCGLPIWRIQPSSTAIEGPHLTGARNLLDGRWRHGTGNFITGRWPPLSCRTARNDQAGSACVEDSLPAHWKAHPAA